MASAIFAFQAKTERITVPRGLHAVAASRPGFLPRSVGGGSGLGCFYKCERLAFAIDIRRCPMTDPGIPLMRKSILALTVVFAVTIATGAVAQAVPEYKLALQNRKFEPATLKVPANTKVKVLVTNRDPVPMEFESADFNREKIVLPNSTVTVFVGPLEKGTYKFFDDFHQATTGVLVVE
jgi:hypothetical protein